MDRQMRNHRRARRRIRRIASAGMVLSVLFLSAGCSSLSEHFAELDERPARSFQQPVVGSPFPQAQHIVNRLAVEPTPGRPSPAPQGNGIILARLGDPQSAEQPPPIATGPAKDKATGPKEEILPAPRTLPLAGLTLDQAISLTITSDPKIRAGLETVNQANADLLTSSLLPNPTFLTDGIFLPLQKWTPDRPGGPPQMDVQLSYSIDWFLFGKRVAAMASASAGVRASEADYADLIRQRVTDTAVAFYDVQEAQALLELAREDLANLQKVERATEKAVQKGLGGLPPIQLKRVRLDVLKSEQTLREAQLSLAEAEARLLARLGQKHAEATIMLAGNLDASLTVRPLPIAQALALAEQNRPDIISLRLQIEKADRDIRVEKTKAWPQVTPMLGYSRQFQQQALGVPDADSLSTSLTITLPVSDRNQGNIAKAKSVFAQNSLNLESALVDLRAEIVQVVGEFETAHKTAVAVADEQLKTAKDVLRSITESFDAGGSTLLDVLDAQRTYRDTHRLYITSRANYWRSAYKFKSAIGQWGTPNE